MKNTLYLIPCLKDYSIEPKGVLHIGAGNLEEAEDYRGYDFKRVVWVDALVPSEEILKRESERGSGTVFINAVLDQIIMKSVEFHVMSNGSSSSLLRLGSHAELYPMITEKEIVLVDTTTGASLMDEYKECESCNVLNVDVQGAESNVLSGFRFHLQQFDCIYSEIYLDEVYIECGKLQEMDRLLWHFGFVRMDTWIKPGEGWGNAFWMKKSLL